MNTEDLNQIKIHQGAKQTNTSAEQSHGPFEQEQRVTRKLKEEILSENKKLLKQHKSLENMRKAETKGLKENKV